MRKGCADIAVTIAANGRKGGFRKGRPRCDTEGALAGRDAVASAAKGHPRDRPLQSRSTFSEVPRRYGTLRKRLIVDLSGELPFFCFCLLLDGRS